jgi:sugar transferase (PEP-CTERM/EpsH1 system associated)
MAAPVSADPDAPPLVAHVIYRFATGGTENGMVNLINHLPADAFRHAIVALSDVDPAFAARLRNPAVEIVAMRKPPGHGYRMYARLFRLFRELRPTIVHTRNLAALEASFPAWAAGVPARVHGEHGWDMADPGGRRRTMKWVRRAYRPFVNRYVAVSRGLVDYLRQVGIPSTRIEQIYNGVDLHRYRPAQGARATIEGCPFGAPDHWLVGTVGRMQAVKDQLTLVRAFIQALEIAPSQSSRLRLVLVGDGPLRAQALALLEAARLSDLAWLPGERGDVAEILRGLDCFVLPSLAEGISNTILEAMACGLPVIATNVGGNPELVVAGETGRLVPAADPVSLARALLDLAADPGSARAMGRAGRSRAAAQFGLDVMVRRYRRLYEQMLPRAARPAKEARTVP